MRHPCRMIPPDRKNTFSSSMAAHVIYGLFLGKNCLSIDDKRVIYGPHVSSMAFYAISDFGGRRFIAAFACRGATFEMEPKL
jgi:hypothetical protein